MSSIYVIKWCKLHQIRYIIWNKNSPFSIPSPRADLGFTLPSKERRVLLIVWNICFQTIFYPFMSFSLCPCRTIYLLISVLSFVISYSLFPLGLFSCSLGVFRSWMLNSSISCLSSFLFEHLRRNCPYIGPQQHATIFWHFQNYSPVPSISHWHYDFLFERRNICKIF